MQYNLTGLHGAIFQIYIHKTNKQKYLLRFRLSTIPIDTFNFSELTASIMNKRDSTDSK